MKLVQVLLDIIPSFSCVNRTTQLEVASRSAEVQLILLSVSGMVTLNKLDNAGPSMDPSGTPLVAGTLSH